jgi:peroxiredoxin
MAGALDYNRYPHFDMSEIIRELEFGFKKYQMLNPLKKGGEVPDFIFEKDNFRWKQFTNGVETNGPVYLLQLLNKPLVVAFYSGHWQSHGLDLLKQLNDLQHDIKSSGANLLIISSENERRLDKLAWDNKLSLSFYFDTENLVAEKFGVYSEDDPVWNRFSGIDTNVPLLTTYVISPLGKILFDHTDWNFSGNFPAEELISAVKSKELSS